MTLAIILFVCPAGDFGSCRKVRLDAPGMAAAQAVVAGWLEEHPGYGWPTWRMAR